MLVLHAQNDGVVDAHAVVAMNECFNNAIHSVRSLVAKHHVVELATERRGHHQWLITLEHQG